MSSLLTSGEFLFLDNKKRNLSNMEFSLTMDGQKAKLIEIWVEGQILTLVLGFYF